ncbi:ATP-binding response regulator [Chthonobacter albigriseus]|uniref:ATP-binding response regulator n=1 Tax=Chthonobacter albigriseus TaxID=1683161 RepID=UPI0015EFBBDB|nr:ATP-binding protein [Chthonobacter albigriseus]
MSDSGTDAAALAAELAEARRELDSRRDELQRLNRELEDTNRGIVALYSELDQRADQLREASELKSRFLSYVSHEFRTPLNSIMGLARILLDRLDGDLSAEQERQVVYIRQSAESLTELVNDLLDLAKVEAGRLDLKPTVFALPDLFAALRGALRPLQAGRDVRLVIDTGPDIRLRTDEAKVAQILRNLVSNGLKFTETGEVRVSARIVDDGGLLIEVRDTGIGIAPEHQAKIFEEFGQIDTALHRRHKGTGLGLPLSRRLAELLGGSLDVESTPGRGSTFRLTLPASVVLRDGGGEAGASTRTILVIDDDPSFRYLVRQLLKDRPEIRVREALDGHNGLNRLRADPADVVLLDLNMPGMAGAEVVEALRRDGWPAGTAVVVATSDPITPALRARLEGVAEFLPKHEISRHSLLEAIGRSAERRLKS